jgi:hypothetical protein
MGARLRRARHRVERSHRGTREAPPSASRIAPAAAATLKLFRGCDSFCTLHERLARWFTTHIGAALPELSTSARSR